MRMRCSTCWPAVWAMVLMIPCCCPPQGTREHHDV